MEVLAASEGEDYVVTQISIHVARGGMGDRVCEILVPRAFVVVGVLVVGQDEIGWGQGRHVEYPLACITKYHCHPHKGTSERGYVSLYRNKFNKRRNRGISPLTKVPIRSTLRCRQAKFGIDRVGVMSSPRSKKTVEVSW